ncbi:MAG: alpha-2-macroglobulin family protein [Opitutus sp.]
MITTSHLVLVALFSLGSTVALRAASRETQWKEVDEAVRLGQPKTAIERLDPIIAAALADHATAEAIKALGRKISLEGEIQGNKAEEKITRLQGELEKALPAMKPVMEALLAHWYWQFFQQNRWRFIQRTQTAGASGADLATWDLSRVLTEIDRHFSAALADEAVLKATPIREFELLLEPGKAPDAYRPTLFDFLVYDALQFYQAGEQAAVVAEEEFEIDATGPVFSDVAAFQNWKPATNDTASAKLKAVSLYQSLLKFHASDADRSPFLDADLARLTYGHNVAVGETKDERSKAALQQFIQQNGGHEISSRARAALANQLQAEGEPAQARTIAQAGYDAYPESAGGAMCWNLIQQIIAPSAQLQTEHVWNAPWPTLDVTYRNVTKIYFRALPVAFDAYVARSRWGFGSVDPERDQLFAQKAALEWSSDLPPTTDLKDHVAKLPAPATLKPGFYVIVASYNPSFPQTDNQISVASVWVSKLALVLRLRSDATPSSGLVVDAVSGEPVAGATVRLWQRNNDGWLKPIEPTTTDADGKFPLPSKSQSLVVLAEHDGEAVASGHELYVSGRSPRERTESQTVFFTDRALYRPGQTISYKAVSIRYNQSAGKYSAIAGLSLTIVFSDPNGQEIARATQTTNDYGSISGVFTAPRDRLMGHMTIQVLGRPSSTSINVEEYKRPKFQVKLEAPVDAAKLGATVTLTGKATAYTGASIGGAKVKWRVERGVQLPSWCWWWQPPAVKAIAHGSAITEPDGTFKIQFAAEPDRAVPVRNEPVFVFNLNADVTDTSGETRSDQRAVRAGYTALQATLQADEWQTPDKPVVFSIGTVSLDGDPQAATGMIKVYALKQPAKVERAAITDARPWRPLATTEPLPDPANPETWEVGDVVAQTEFRTDGTGTTKTVTPLAAGIYRAVVETKDRFGHAVTARTTVLVVDPQAPRYGVKLANHFVAPKWSIEPGKPFTALWGTGYDHGRALVELESNGKVLKTYWTASDRTQAVVDLPVLEVMRGGFTVRVTYVRENRAYLNERIVNVPWSNKELSIKWESFRSKLLPGQKETWTAVVNGPDAKRASAEMVAALYDASLDQFRPHDWPHAFEVFRSESSRTNVQFENRAVGFQVLFGWNSPTQRDATWSYRAFSPEIIGYGSSNEVVMLSAFSVSEGRGGSRSRPSARVVTEQMMRDVAAPAALAYTPAQAKAGVVTDALVLQQGATPAVEANPPKIDLANVSARKNLNETAFFFPQLVTGEDGLVRMVFTMPEALTEWKFLGFAHDRELRSGFITDKAVTAKDLMVEPNAPRFVREGDAIEFTVKVSNRTDQAQTGTVRLTFADAASLESRDAALGHQAIEQAFNVPAKQSQSYSWRITIPDGLTVLTYKVVGATARASDGEEGFLPVLSRRVLVTESLPLPIRGKVTKPFEFTKLLESASSNTLRHQSLTVQMTSQPAWYAVMALPYLMEFPYECSEQVFNRFYANALAAHIANSDPKIRRIFDLWRNTSALESPLEKNQELKSVLIEETPWLRQAQSETQARKNVGLLFDRNRLDDESARVLRALSERQASDGLWSWFPGGRPSEYISLYIMTGFGRLRHLGVTLDPQAAVKSLAGLDAWIEREYRDIQNHPEPGNHVPTSIEALYLYGRSFFLEDRPLAKDHQEAINFFVQQSRKFWLQLNNRQSQAHLALALQRFGDKSTAQLIVRSLKERSVTSEELGMFWRESEQSWWWYRAPIETQAMMIEAFAEVGDDAQSVENCKVWLLKQKQTQDWRTTKATADAVYGLLVRGDRLLASDAIVEVALAGETIKPEKVEAGTGFYERSFTRGEIKASMGRITVKKVDEGVSWGSVHWQYLEDIAKITPHEGTPLQLKKTLYVKETTGQGQVLRPVSGSLSVGDELVVRLELRTDRDMEFVHLKDQRGSGTEPVNVLSQYKYQDGLAYYESTRDTASHFFIDYLPKGVYVFEYSTRVQLKGRYQSGLAEIQCMYAPEFNSHSESVLLDVK